MAISRTAMIRIVQRTQCAIRSQRDSILLLIFQVCSAAISPRVLAERATDFPTNGVCFIHKRNGLRRSCCKTQANRLPPQGESLARY